MMASDAPRAGPRVLFVVMPWADVQSGSLGVGTLKAVLAREGLAADVRHFNLRLAARLGVDTYSLVSQLGGGPYRGEVFFSPHYFHRPLDGFVEHELGEYCTGLFSFLQETSTAERYGSEAGFRARMAELARDGVPAFLSECLEGTPWDEYDVVGFSLMFDQTLPSLCLARALKERHPHLKVVFGGAACDGEMGAEMLRSFACVDVVARGEADLTVAGLVRALRGEGDLADCPGIVFRRDGQVVETPPAPAVHDLDALPAPDFADYVAEARRVDSFRPSLYFESSRGCWWGQKKLCSFCGLNASGVAFRRKSPGRVLQELLAQEAAHGISTFVAADNIVDMSYFRSLLPEVAAINAERREDERISLFYETKSNLRKWQMALLKDAGVNALQPGIESFSDHVLELMRKGSTAIQQVQFLKWATEMGLRVIYGVLWGNPGETREDYEEMLDTVRMLRHLAPPVYVTPITLDRFSPYFNDPAAYGIRGVRAHASYRHLYPDPAIDHDRLAYKFSFDHDDRADAGLQGAIAACLDEMKGWRAGFRPDRLVYVREDDAVKVVDRRGARPVVGTLRGVQAALFDFCDEHRSFQGICTRFHPLPPERIRGFLELLVARGWMFRDRRDRFIALPVLRDTAALRRFAQEHAGALAHA